MCTNDVDYSYILIAVHFIPTVNHTQCTHVVDGMCREVEYYYHMRQLRGISNDTRRFEGVCVCVCVCVCACVCVCVCVCAHVCVGL